MNQHPLTRRSLWVALSLFAFAALPQSAEAQFFPFSPDQIAQDVASVINPPRPFFVGVGAGPAINIDNYHADVQAMFVQEFGYHLMGTSDGFFAALSAAESFSDSLTNFQFGARVGWDFTLVEGIGFALRLAPSLALGVGIHSVSVFGASRTDASFNIQPAADIRFTFLDGMVTVFLRPVSFDFYIQDPSAVRYNILAGLAFNF